MGEDCCSTMDVVGNVIPNDNTSFGWTAHNHS